MGLYGGLTALLASTFICCIGMVVKPMHFDWQILLDGIKLVSGDGGENTKVLGDDSDGTPEALLAAKSWVFKYGWGLSLLLVVAWPLACVPMGAFAKSTFQIWSGVALMWGYIGSIVIVGLPIYESSDGLGDFFQKMAGKAPPHEGDHHRVLPLRNRHRVTPPSHVWSGVALMWGYIGSLVIAGLPFRFMRALTASVFLHEDGRQGTPHEGDHHTESNPSETATASHVALSRDAAYEVTIPTAPSRAPRVVCSDSLSPGLAWQSRGVL